MADPRTFTLIGEFKDGITPELQKINNQLATLKSSFAGIGNRKNTGFRGATQEIGKLVSAHKNLSKSIKEVKSDLESTVGVLQQYRREMGKAAAANRSFQKAGGNLGGGAFAKNMRQANTEAQRYLKTLQQINSQSPRAMRMPSGGAGGGGPRPPRSGGGAGGGPGGFHMAEFGFAYTLGNAISQPIQSSIVQGFQIGIGFMTKPFEYFANRFGERVQDELSDLKAAGGFFSIAQRQEGEKFIKSFDQAVDFTQANNKVLAKLAASLPGSTQDYIEVSKRISDSVARTVMTDKGEAVKYAEEIRKKDPGTYGLQSIEGTGAGAQQRAIQVMLGEMTKKTVLAGQGGRAGAGGMMGAYGLPQLTERMLSQDTVSMGQFQRYSAIFSDPMIMDALSREIPNINKTAKNSVDRFKALEKLFDTVLPPELVARYRRTFAGIQETFNTALFGPETGLFGLGRKMQGLGKKMNEFGEYVDKYGNVVAEAGLAMNADLSIYDLFRDTIVNIGQVLSPLVENFTLLWDPLQKIGFDLKRAREVTAAVLRSFHGYMKGWEDFEKGLSKDAKLLFQQGGGAPLRATLSTLTNLLAEVGAIGDVDFAKYRDMMKDPSAKLGPMFLEMVDKLLDSDVAKSIGETIGSIIGTVLVEVSKVTGLISGRIGKSNKLVSGIQKGFKDAGGEQAFSNIFKDVFTAMFNVLKTVWNLIPWQGKFLAVAMVIVPAAIQGLGMLLAEKLVAGIGKLRNACVGSLNKTFKDAASCGEAAGGGGSGGRRRRPGEYGKYRGRPQRYGAGGSIERLNRMRRYRAGQATSFIGEAAGLGYEAMGAPGKGMFKGAAKGMGRGMKGIGRVGRAIPGGALAMGAVDMGLAMASGESFGQAAAGTIGSVLGATLGTVFGPVGTMIGGVAGGYIGDALYTATVGQSEAARKQLEAANKQVAAATDTAMLKYGAAGEQLGGVEALSKAMGGGAGVQKFAAEQLKAGKILPEQAQQYDILGRQMTELNATTSRVTVLQGQYSTASRLGTGEQKKLAAELAAAKTKQKTAIDAINRGWSEISSNNRIKILSAVDELALAIRQGAAEVKDASGQGGGRGGGGSPGGLNPSLAPTPTPSPGRTYRGGQRSGKSSYAGSLGDAISKEMRMKPPGSSLVVANSSETIIPAARGYGMTDFMKTMKTGFNEVIAQVKYGGGKVAKPGGGSANWMQILEQDYLKNLNKPIPGGPVRGSGRGGLDMWEGPQAYVSPGSLQTGGYGGANASSPVNITAPITIHQQPNQDAEELATIVAMKIGDAVAQARSASVFV